MTTLRQSGGSPRQPPTQQCAITSSIPQDRVASVVAPGAIPWLLLKVVWAEVGPTGEGALAATTWIQRLNTAGGVAPPDGCAVSTDVGKRAFVPYRADYFFFRNRHDDD